MYPSYYVWEIRFANMNVNMLCHIKWRRFPVWNWTAHIFFQGELDEFYARCGNEAILNPESIQSLVYLRSCVKEAFRLYPTASQIARLTEKPIRVNGGHILPPYSVVLCHTMVACRQVKMPINNTVVWLRQRTSTSLSKKISSTYEAFPQAKRRYMHT